MKTLLVVVAAIQKQIKRSSKGVKGPLNLIGITMKRTGPFDQLVLANQYLKSGKVLTHQGNYPHEEVIDSDNSLPKDGPGFISFCGGIATMTAESAGRGVKSS